MNRFHLITAGCLFIAGVSACRATDVATLDQRLIANILATSANVGNVQSYMSSLQANGSWADVSYTDTSQTNWKPETHLDRLHEMAKAYADPTNTLYQNASLKADILKAYDYWISSNPQSTNWWYNQIGAPTSLGDTLLLTWSILSSTEQSSGLTILTRAYVSRSTNSGTNTGENRIGRAEISIDRGVLSNSSSLLSESFGAIGDTVLSTTGDGVQSDFSFHQHGPQLYGGGYGMEYGGDTTKISALAAGTAYAFTSTQQQFLVDYLLNGQQWFVRGEAYEYTGNGRGVTRPGTSTLALSLIPAVQNALASGTYRQAELQAMLNRLTTAKSTGQPDPTNELSGNRLFWDSDIMVQQRPSYYASVKFSSTRTAQPETGNNEGLQNLFLADGVNMIMQTGHEYDNIFPVWDWRRLPGTTTEQGTYTLKPAADWGVMGTSTFAGGVSDGTYGATVFNYSRLNVAAKKSWFFFDNEYVALGAAINAPNATSPVITTLNQSLLNGPVTYATSSGGTQSLASGAVTTGGLQWVVQDGIGYYFPISPGSATVQAISQSGSWYAINQSYSQATVTANVFSLQINHPSKPVNDSYEYVVVPGATSASMASYSANLPITILRNDSTAQAVRENNLNVTQAVFYAPSTVTVDPALNYWVSAGSASAVMLSPAAGGLEISAANPAAAAMTLKVQVGLPLKGYTDLTLDGSTVSIALPGGTLAGSTVTQTFALADVWDANAAAGWQAGAGTWGGAAGPAPWSTSLAGTTSLAWSDSGEAWFMASGSSPITVAGAVNVSKMNITGSGYAFSGGSLNVAAGIATRANATIGSLVTIGSAQTWLSATQGQTLTFTGNVNTGSKLLTIDGLGNTSISGAIGGSAGLTKTGSGGLTLGGTNSFTGNVTVSMGSLTITNSSALGSGAKTIYLSNGTAGRPQLHLDGSQGNINLPSTLTYQTSNVNGTIFNDAGNNSMSGTIILTSGGGDTSIAVNAGSLLVSGSMYANTTLRRLRLDGPSSGTLSAILTESGSYSWGISKYGSGSWTVSNSADAYSGYTAIYGGTLIVASLANGGQASALGESSNAASNLQLSGGTLSYTGSGAATDRLFTLAGATTDGLDASGAGAIVFTNKGKIAFSGSGNRTLDLSGSNRGSNTLDTAITDNGSEQTSLLKSGPGEWVLSGTNTYSGGTTVTDGTLLLTNAQALPDGQSLTVGSDTMEFEEELPPGTIEEGISTSIVSPSVATEMEASGADVVMSVPEPSSVIILAAGGLLAAALRRTKVTTASKNP